MIAQTLFCFKNICRSESEEEDRILILELLIIVFTMKISLFLLGINHILRTIYFGRLYYFGCILDNIFLFL